MKNLMKSLMQVMLMICLVLPVLFVAGVAPVLATDGFYVVTLSTNPSTTAPTSVGVLTPNINKAIVKVKRITVSNSAALAQTVTFYKNCTSTTTAVEVWRADIPATIGCYEIVPPISTIYGDGDTYSWPYTGVKSSTSTTPASVNIYYKY